MFLRCSLVSTVSPSGCQSLFPEDLLLNEAQTTYNSNDNGGGPVSKCGGCNKLGEAPGVTMHRRLPPTSLVDQKKKQKEYYNYRRLYEHFKR